MDKMICVPISTNQFLSVIDFIRREGSDRDPAEVIAEFIEKGMILAAPDPDTFLHHRPAEDARGYSWKSKTTHLFMPNGTDIRMRYDGRFHYAKVVGDEIIYEGIAYSPASLANTIAGSSRNAWRDLWIKKPEQSDWKLADTYRSPETNLTAEELGL